MNEQTGSNELEVRETFKLAPEFAPHVTVTEETFFGHGWQPLTTSILMSLWFLPADTSFDVPFLVDWYQRLGWKGANGKPLGAPVVRREIGLIREAGYISVTRLRGENGQAVGIQYSVSQRRSDQPESGAWIPVLPGTEGIRRSDHVQPMPTRGESPHVVNGKNRRSDHVQPMPTRGESPHVVNAPKPQVAPRVANDVPPPHPPEEVTTSSPYPHADTDGSSSLPSQMGEGREFSPKEIHAAESFLQRMAAPWNAGKATATKCAPLLLRVMAEEGWPSIFDVDKRVLERDITKDPRGITRHSQVLPGRIKDLSLYEAVAPAPRQVPAQQPIEQDRGPISTESITSLLEALQKPSL
ncbi:hypothetical protein [[Kitasatospora] papulosa]|uniref:hypothetical protein n=1 Tax=[Kitasatospora] papulosa TaxID=1464011 RepID=UPI0038573E62